MKERRQLIIAMGAVALTTPLAAVAQTQGAKPARIGILGPGSATSNAGFLAALLTELRALGYVEGKNIALESRWSEAALDRLPALAAELVGLKVDAMLAAQTSSAQAAKQATSTIPIVMAGVADPLASGLIASLARPGGNVTGLSGATSELAAKTLELLRDMLPATRRVGVPANSADPFSKLFVERVELAGRHLGINLMTFKVRGEEGLRVQPDSGAGSGRTWESSAKNRPQRSSFHCPLVPWLGYGPSNAAKTVLAGAEFRFRRPKSDRLLVVILFELMAHCRDDHFCGSGNLEERNIAGIAKPNDQLAQKGVLACLAAGEGRAPQSGDPRTDGGKRLLGQPEVATGLSKFPLDDEVEQAQKISLGVTGEADPKAHRRVACLRIRAASNLCCNFRNTVSAST